MTARSFIFCDHCNPQGIRHVEVRRHSSRMGDGRRISDGRYWYEGTEAEAVAEGWQATADQQHMCPRCQNLETPESAPDPE